MLSVTSFVLRWNPQILTVSEQLGSGLIGDLIYAEACYWHSVPADLPAGQAWRYGHDMPVTAFVSGGCHAVDMLRYLAGRTATGAGRGGDDIAEVSAFSCAPDSARRFGFDPAVVANVRFASGAVGTASALLEGDTPYVFGTRPVGTAGAIRDNATLSSARDPGKHDYQSFDTVPPTSGDVAHHPFAAEPDHFVRCIRTGTPSHADIDDTWRSMAACVVIDQSAAAGGRPVR